MKRRRAVFTISSAEILVCPTIVFKLSATCCSTFTWRPVSKFFLGLLGSLIGKILALFYIDSEYYCALAAKVTATNVALLRGIEALGLLFSASTRLICKVR